MYSRLGGSVSRIAFGYFFGSLIPIGVSSNRFAISVGSRRGGAFVSSVCSRGLASTVGAIVNLSVALGVVLRRSRRGVLGTRRRDRKLSFRSFFAFRGFVINSAGHFTRTTTLTITRTPIPRPSCGPLIVCNPSNINGARLLLTVGGRVGGGCPGGIIRFVENRRFAGRLVGTLRGNGLNVSSVGSFGGGFEGISILLVSSVRFVTNGRRARRRFCGAFSTLCRGGGRVIIALSHPIGRVGALGRHVGSHLRNKLCNSVAPPSFRAEINVVGGGTRRDKVALSRTLICCVTSRVGSGAHRLRNVIGGLRTCVAVRGGAPGVSIIRTFVHSVVASSGPRPVGVRDVVVRITEACGISRTSVLSGEEATTLTLTERITVCVTEIAASLSCGTVNRDFKGSRAAILCGMGHVRRFLGSGPCRRRLIRSVVGGLGRGTGNNCWRLGAWLEFGLVKWILVAFLEFFCWLFVGVLFGALGPLSWESGLCFPPFWRPLLLLLSFCFFWKRGVVGFAIRHTGLLRTILGLRDMINSGASVPMLRNVLVSTRRKGVALVSCGLRVNVGGRVCSGYRRDNSVIVTTGLLSSVLEHVGNMSIRVSTSDGLGYGVGYNRTAFSVVNVTTASFPRVPAISTRGDFGLDNGLFVSLGGNATFTTTRGRNTGPVLANVGVSIGSNFVRFITVSNCHLTVGGRGMRGVGGLRFAMANGSLGRTMGLVSSRGRRVRVGINDHLVNFGIGKCAFVSHLLRNSFMGCRGAVPRDRGREIIIGAHDLVSAVRHISLLVDRSFAAPIHYCFGRLGIIFAYTATVKHTARAFGVGLRNRGFRVNLGGRCLLSMLGTVSGRGVRVLFGKPGTNILVLPLDSSGFGCVVVPVELGW